MKMEPAPAVPVYGVVVERDVDVPMRDGARLKADVFRPDDAGKFPAILNLGPYQKDKLWVPSDTLEEKPNPLMNWETVNPQWWVPRGYICVRVDERGSGKSPGQSVLYSPQEAIDFYDAIEWAGHKSWSNGRVATIGISFFARTQWWKLAPHDELLTCETRRGRDSQELGRIAPPQTTYWCLAEPGRQYLVYFRGLRSPLILALETKTAAWMAVRINPRTNEQVALAAIDGDRLDIRPPDDQDWVVLITAPRPK